jgi:hypothetical protein
MRGSPISRSSSGRSTLPQASRVTVALTPRSLVKFVNHLDPGVGSVRESLDVERR